MQVSKEQLERARQMDLLTYLQYYDPGELTKVSPGVYSTKSHDSLKISHGKWCWWSRHIGGTSALDYLIKVREMSLPEATLEILREPPELPPTAFSQKARPRASPQQSRKLALPPQNENNDRLVDYLIGRGLHLELIDYCLKTGRMYESREPRQSYGREVLIHNVVFIGRDKAGVPRYGAVRGMFGRFHGDLSGSDKHYSFSVQPEEKSHRLHLFECPIDLLSHGTMERMAGRNWRGEHLLSLAGVYQPPEKIEDSTLPMAVKQYLIDYPEIQEINMHFDRDATGRQAAEIIRYHLAGRYALHDDPPRRGKDVNENLCLQMGILKPRTMER